MRRLGYWIAAIILTTTTSAIAQRAEVPTNKQELTKFASAAAKDYKANRAKALELAKQNSWIIEKTYSDGRHISLQGLDSKGMPIYYITYNNTRAAATVGTDQLWAGGSLGLALSGANSIVSERLGVWDGGRVRETHQELSGRVQQRDNATQVSDHATHVAGTMIASGVSPLAKGMAFGTKKLQAYDFNNDVSEMATAAKDLQLLVSNHSYGSLSGWRYNPDRKGTTTDPYWEWWGDSEINSSEDYKFGYYDKAASEWDKIAFNAPYYLIVKSSGNNRGETGPSQGQPYYRRNKNGNFDLVASRNNISSNDGFDIISTYGNAKNILTVGAVKPISYGYSKPEDVAISSFSSYGPTDDGRIKPDIVGNGVDLLSASGSGNRSYEIMSGTSMSSPNIAGSILLLQEHYANVKSGNLMRAATLKGLIIHTADEAGPKPGPDYIYGWGLLNNVKAANTITNTNNTNIIEERNLEQGQVQTLQVIASGSGPVVATISWTDPEATPIQVGSAVFNNRTPRLVNDLDIRITNSGNEYMPWKLDPSAPSKEATTGDNILDNVEKILIQDAIPGETYTIKVSHKGTLVNKAQQFSLIVSGVGGRTYCTSTPSVDSGSRIDNIVFGQFTLTMPAGCSGYNDFRNKLLTIEAGQTKNMTLSLGTCSDNASKALKVFVDWNQDGDFNDVKEEVATSDLIANAENISLAITAPAVLPKGGRTLLRVVLQEVAQTSEITSCGTYGKGETQDYLIQFMQPQTDVALTAVAPVGPNLCVASTQTVKVKLRNLGAGTQNNLPVTVIVKKNGINFTQLTGIFKGTISTGREVEFSLDGSFKTEAGATYELIATSSLDGDVVTGNNNASTSFTVNNLSPAPIAAISRCGADQDYSLTAEGNGVVYWYTSADATTPVAVGKSINLEAKKLTTNTLYAGVNDLSASVGPATKAVLSTGDYGQFTPEVLISTKAPVVLESARLYIGHGGKITFTLFNSTGQPVTFKTIDVVPTRSSAATGNQPNDATDQGAIYNLGLEIPSAGNYRIAISYEEDATIFRNKGTLVSYPLQIADVFEITGNTASPNPETYYYYFYDLKVSALGCKSERVAVEVKGKNAIEQAILTREGETLKSNALEGNQWYLNGKAIAGATGQTFTPTENGKYSLVATVDGCVSKRSEEYSFVYRPGAAELGDKVIVSPNPSTGKFYIAAELIPSDIIRYEVYNILGNMMSTGKVDNYNGIFEDTIDLSNSSSGVYFIRIYKNEAMHVQKLVLQR
ncbi:S8 family serine peptidase [Pontibacter pudoricolor]|uniref:S8 family serine peptidase n=1 Tax=Pontibacter pudoricolor TaxID=2694930 RepID=UPI001390F811|nr:S8 family serine peptidase [Pontibacter pudoricolor]